MAENKNNKKGKASTQKNNVKKVTEIIEDTEVIESKEKKENLKQARKQLYYSDKSESNELTKLIKIVLIVTVIIIVFYGVTVIVTNKVKEVREEQNKQPVEIQYDSIMIGSMLNIDGSFYVLIENPDDIRLSEYTTLLQTIKANEDAPIVYTADLGSTFNNNYLSDKSNYNSDMENFKVTGTTLVRVRNHKISDVYDNYDDIIKKLDELD